MQVVDSDSGPIKGLPRLVFKPLGLGRSASINIDGQLFHKIDPYQAFSQTLGERPDTYVGGALGDEFLWKRYRRDGAKMSPLCFQSQIAIYLHNNSLTFDELYGATYKSMLGNCSLKCMDGGDEHCSVCPMHPSKIVAT